MSKISRVRVLTSSHRLPSLLAKGGTFYSAHRFPCPHGEPLPSHLVEESLAEVLHGALELAALGLPLLVVPHVLSCGALPGGGPSVVIHIVKPASGVCAFFPAGNIKLSMTVVATPYPKSYRNLRMAGKKGPRGG